MTQRFLPFVLLTTLMATLYPWQAIFAFDPNYIISDEEMTEADSLDVEGIQQHLERGYLADYVTADLDGKKRTAAEIIYRAAQTYELNPKFIMGMLQREQSLIDDDEPTQKQLDWAMGYGVCDACTTSDGAIQRWQGFAKQIDSAAQQFRDGYLADLETYGETIVGYGPGITSKIDDIKVTPANNATAALYTYTPHIHGNANLARIWQAYFTQTYPNGSLLQAKGEDGVWYIQYGVRRPITSRTALVSRFNPDNIIQVDASALLTYEQGPAIAFANYSLVKAPTGTIFLIVDDERRGIDSMETFRQLGFTEDQVMEATWDDLNAYEAGDDITMDSIYPQGHLLQNASTGGIYFVQDGVKHPLKSKFILDINFQGWRIHPTAPEELETYKTGSAVTLPEGTLVKSTIEPAVYVISEGERLPISSGDVFETMGWDWNKIVTVDQVTLELHPLGAPITIEQEHATVQEALAH